MKRLHFNIHINAVKQKVWKILWDKDTYCQWTSVFGDGYYKADEWKEGARIQFLNTSGSGMFSEIHKLIDEQYVSFKHLGEIKDGVEMPADAATTAWAGSMEIYSLTEAGDGTDLIAELDITPDHESFFAEKFPQALQLIKELAE